MEEEVGERWRSEERVWEVEEEVVVGRRERVVGAVAEAMAKCLCYVSEKSERGRECVCVCVFVFVCEGFDYYVDVGNGVVFDWVLLLGQRERCGREEGMGMIGQCVDFSYR